MYAITENANKPENVWYDYKNQAWVVDDHYERCGHLDECNCYGRQHEGELATAAAEVV